MSKLIPIGFKAGPITVGNYTDAGGAPTTVDAVTSIQSSDPTVVEIRDIGGASFAVAIKAGSSVQISAVVDVRLGPDVREVTFVGAETIDVPAGEAAFADIGLGDVTPV